MHVCSSLFSCTVLLKGPEELVGYVTYVESPSREWTFLLRGPGRNHMARLHLKTSILVHGEADKASHATLGAAGPILTFLYVLLSDGSSNVRQRGSHFLWTTDRSFMISSRTDDTRGVTGKMKVRRHSIISPLSRSYSTRSDPSALSGRGNPKAFNISSPRTGLGELLTMQIFGTWM